MAGPDFDVVIVGAGVIGLAAAHALARSGRGVLLLESATAVGTETSSRNSEVIHAGIYYPPDSLKATFCVRGRALLYDYCSARGIPHRRCGKIIVASNDAQVAGLDALRANACANGVDDVRHLSRREVAQLEPDIVCASGLLSPSTGIIDAHSFMQTLLGDAVSQGAEIVCRARVRSIRCAPDGWSIYVDGEDEPVLSARAVVLTAGHSAQAVAATIEGMPFAAIPKAFYAKGSYFAYGAATPFRHLVYPLPEPGGLGVHLTLDLAGRARFGPDVEWTDRIDYRVTADRHSDFVAAIRRYWPGVEPGRLVPDYAGVRPKLSGPGEPPADFRIVTEREHGLAGIVCLYGIESPGLTASLAIAERIDREVAIACQ